MTILGLYIVSSWTLLCTLCLAFPEIHKQMKPDDLRSVFHVESIEEVPPYDIVKLKHDGTAHHSEIHHTQKRSISDNFLQTSKPSHHVKKDLSKSPYYSKLKEISGYERNSRSENQLTDDHHDYIYKLKNLHLSQIKEHNVSFSAFGENMNLTLKSTEGLFKNGPKSLRMWEVKNQPNSTEGLQYDEIISDPSNKDEDIGEIFQDDKNMAAILMRRQLETGDLVMEGSIGHDIVIKPLPHEFSPNKDEAHHVVYRREVNPMDQMSDFALMEPDEDVLEPEAEETKVKHVRKRRAAKNRRSGRNARSRVSSQRFSAGTRGRRATAQTIYPEILVIVDYDGYRLHGGDNLQTKRYFVSFWNAVDLRYRQLDGPRIHISIAGIIISRGRDATPYLERNRVGRDAIDSAAALTDLGKYLFRERRLPVYDIAVAITKYDMCRRRKGGRCTKGTAGFAYVGGACVVNKRLEKVNSVAIIEDTGGFSGIIVAAHEVGHLLGAVHDGSPPPSYLGGPGAEACPWTDGYIMSDLRHTERGFRWSFCSIRSFHHFLRGDTASCLRNTPHEDHSLGRQLPGTLLSLDAQCRRDRGTYACFKDDRVCVQLFCFDASSGYCVAYRPAAEGSSCGNGLYCLDGKCVRQPFNSYRPTYHSDDNHDDDDDENDDNQDDFDSTTTTISPTPTTSTIETTIPSKFYNNNNLIDSFSTNSITTKTHISPDNSFDVPTTARAPPSIITTIKPFPDSNSKSNSNSNSIKRSPKILNTNRQDVDLKNQFEMFDRSETTRSNRTIISTSSTSSTSLKINPVPVRRTCNKTSSHNIDKNDKKNRNRVSDKSRRVQLPRSSFFETYFQRLTSAAQNPFNFYNLAQYPRHNSTIKPQPQSPSTSNDPGDQDNC